MIVVGLGNPGARYEDTRHNIGFHAIDLIAERWGRPVFREKFRGRYAAVDLPAAAGKERTILLKPETFMNLSGESVQPALVFFKERPESLVVVHDELDLPLGRLQLKFGGGSGGHNGLKSVTERLGTPNYLRLRLGIGRPRPDFRGDIADFVLQAFAPDEVPTSRELVQRAGDAVELLALRGKDAAMNHLNQKR